MYSLNDWSLNIVDIRSEEVPLFESYRAQVQQAIFRIVIVFGRHWLSTHDRFEIASLTLERFCSISKEAAMCIPFISQWSLPFDANNQPMYLTAIFELQGL